MGFTDDEAKEIELNRLFKRQKSALICLLTFFYVGFISLMLGEIQAITDFNYNLHEMLYLPVNMSMILLPVFIILYIYDLIRYLRARGWKRPGLKSSVRAVMVIVPLIIALSITVDYFNQNTTVGWYSVEQKLGHDNEYYLVLDHIKLSVSHNEYQLVEENQMYSIEYVWDSRTRKKETNKN